MTTQAYIKTNTKATKSFTSYLCQWTLSNEIKYNKWVLQRNGYTPNTILYLKPHQYFTNILQTTFNQEQPKDTKYNPHHKPYTYATSTPTSVIHNTT